jgi:hypothetical protein
VTSGDNVRLIGTRLPDVSQCHIILRSAATYFRLLINHDTIIPLWKDILLTQKQKFEKTKNECNPKMVIPLINIVSIIRSKDRLNVITIDAICINILLIYALWFFHVPLLMLLSL